MLSLILPTPELSRILMYKSVRSDLAVLGSATESAVFIVWYLFNKGEFNGSLSMINTCGHRIPSGDESFAS